MDTTVLQTSSSDCPRKLFWRGTVAMIPLSVAVIPWGLLAGSFAIDAGLNALESQALSAILFAGSAQLVATGMLKAGAGLATLLLTTFFITSRHFLYSVSMRQKVSPMPLKWRLALGFLLTDELFAVCGQQSEKQFNRWYALGAGLSFYLAWNAATLAGIIAGSYIPALNQLGLEFAVAATFIALVIPHVVNLPVVTAVMVSLVLSVMLNHWQVEGALMIASIGGMLAGYLCETWRKKGV
ncbi:MULTISPECIES: AzlC family ABC transporter permease [unclassified Vibrio]|uniref:AzlC family ABC transporter permease n=1 Tax=unclassified Vibrio TaxID=2614977 RepID=UPI0013617AA9|nr:MULTISPECIES: AzlC family ABC transporter permease [unclassified Vibrio]NAW57690.1 branched-chain amino acid ABC transporter permease [Vibrio sp. V36_P2S2PM302]NAX21233.1 branched-chain amino acid ABC transporter permease [Vibrio sp. V39_P1S14PM300]NAX28338.1 branched-chain amino acid ABC transporter permease [Vibrio sp. V38_P2S17PM301]NAX32656.1 branched-chain amino acid ABC transporter permease [Vibrio sp. V37_P2S8PM304]